ncbi:hypothetical protein ACROYT_G004638 [Oculina patagonica]
MGRNVVTEIPSNRWNMEAYYDRGERKSGKMVSNRAGLIEDIDQFDHTFFKISPREAVSMDPQQRHLLEVTYEAFEDAGIDPWGLEGDCGVFVGIGLTDYDTMTCESNMMDAYSITGVTHSVAANRLSYVFNFKGPSLAVDTACASSMTALHLACSALSNKECSVAVVGGCNALLIPEISVGFSAMGVLSPDGQCCPFSDTAKGYVRSEGWGVLILKPLDHAVQNADHIYAVIRGSAIAANGYSNSLTKPSTTAQQRVLEEVYTRCNISLSSIDYLEAHGTGTPVGDPIEAEAIGKTFSPHRSTPLKIGSVKSNFGHNECASGVTATIKVALMLEKQTLCPTINFNSPNPNIDFESLKLEVVRKTEVLETRSCRRVAINSFGVAGALAHAILEQPPQQVQKARDQCKWSFGGEKSGEHIIIPLSAKSKDALTDMVKQWNAFGSSMDALSVVSWLSTRRTHHDSRLAVISNSGSRFRDLLAKYLMCDSSEEEIIIQSSEAKAQTVCFVFPGQGQQWSGMGQRLYCTEPIFRDTVQKCDEIFWQMSGTSLIRDIGLFALPPQNTVDQVIDEIEVSQPAIVFFQIGLIELWSHWGVKPDVVLGHSLGEVAAAYACGGLTIDEAIAVIYHRSTEQIKLKGSGSMVAVRNSLEEVKEMCSKQEGIFVAAINGPRSITIAGESEGIDFILHENPSNSKKLRVQCAFHTPHMDAIKFSFERAMCNAVQTKKPFHLPSFYSSVSGRRYNEDFGTAYWWKNIRQPVQFQSAIECILNEEKPDVFLELGSSVTLLSSIRQIANNFPNDSTVTTLASCRRNKGDRVSILQALGSLYVAGKSINWENVTHNCAQWHPLPTYPWQHQSHWKESEERKKRRLGMEDSSFKGQKGNLSLDKYPFFKDHVIQNQLIFPGAGYVEYLLQICFNQDEIPSLKSVNFTQALVWPHSENKVGTFGEGAVSLEVLQDNNKFYVSYNGVNYCNTEVAKENVCSTNVLQIENICLNFQAKVERREFYLRMKENGFDYGPSFQVVNQVLVGDGEVLGYLEAAPDSKQRIHVTILDGCLQLVIAALGPCTSLYIPTKIASFQMTVSRIPPGEALVAHAVVLDCDSAFLTGDVTLATTDGNILAIVKGVQAQALGNRTAKLDIKSCLYSTVWQPLESRVHLEELEKKLKTDYLKKKYPKGTRVIQKAINNAYVRHAIRAAGKTELNDSAFKNISKETTECMDVYKNVAKNLEDIKHLLPEMEQELSAFQQLEEALPVILEEPNTEKKQTLAKEWWNKYLENSFATKVHLQASAAAITQAIKEAFLKKSVIRVLVVGDWNDGLSTCILPCLKEKGIEHKLEYTFTASTDSLLQNAKQQLKDFTFVKCKYLDIEQDIEEQGFVPESYDLLVSLYELHSKENAVGSLNHMRRLLCNQGCLLIYEVTKVNYLIELLFHPSLSFHLGHSEKILLSTDEWKDTMTRNGFVDVFTVDASYECCPSVIAGYKCKNHTISRRLLPAVDDDITIIAKDGHLLAQVLKEKLTNSGRVQIVSEVSKLQEDDKVAASVIIYMSPSNMEDLPCLVALLQEANNVSFVKSLWVITCGASIKRNKMEGAAVVGLTRAVGNFIHKFPVYSVDVDPLNSPESNGRLVCSLLTSPPPDHEIVINQNRCFVPRVLPFVLEESKEIQSKTWKVGSHQSDDATCLNRSVDELQFLASETMSLQQDELLIEVKAAGLNFKDVMVAMGMLEKLKINDANEGLGLECSGVVADKGCSVTKFEIGDEVIVFQESCFASHIKCNQEHVIHKPQNLNWTESAAVGIVFTTALYCLVERAGLKKGETILIHSASGGVGLAAIQISEMIGAKVICTAGTEEKRRFLKETLKIKYVTDSRSQQFYHDAMKWTEDKGVDVVLNSLSGDLMRKSIDVLSHGGRFCEIGKRDMLENSQILMKSLLENKSFLSCHVDILLSQQPQNFIAIFHKVLQLLTNGTLRPIKTTVYPIAAFKETFRMMSKGVHIGKIVFDVSSEPIPLCVQNSSKLFKPNATYIITGGFGGIGLALSRWMCKKGAKHLVLVSRRGCHNAAGRRLLAFLKRQGVKVFEFAGDLSEESFVQSMITKLKHESSIPPIRGVFHLAGVIKEDSFPDLRPYQLKLILGSKARSAQYLHDLTLDEPLDIFLLMSSVVTVWGNSAQPSYCAANSFLDALAHQRHSLGLPALSLQLGPVQGAGFLEDKTEVAHALFKKGASTLHIDAILSILEKLLKSCDKPVVCLANQNWEFTQQFVYSTCLRFRHLIRSSSDNDGVTSDTLEERIKKKLGDLLQVPVDVVDLHKPMTHYGWNDGCFAGEKSHPGTAVKGLMFKEEIHIKTSDDWRMDE